MTGCKGIQGGVGRRDCTMAIEREDVLLFWQEYVNLKSCLQTETEMKQKQTIPI